MSKIAPYWKAVFGFVAPGVALLGAAVTEQSPGGSSITTAEWVTAVIACVVTASAVWAAPKNAEKP